MQYCWIIATADRWEIETLLAEPSIHKYVNHEWDSLRIHGAVNIANFDKLAYENILHELSMYYDVSPFKL